MPRSTSSCLLLSPLLLPLPLHLFLTYYSSVYCHSLSLSFYHAPAFLIVPLLLLACTIIVPFSFVLKKSKKHAKLIVLSIPSSFALSSRSQPNQGEQQWENNSRPWYVDRAPQNDWVMIRHAKQERRKKEKKKKNRKIDDIEQQRNFLWRQLLINLCVFLVCICDSMWCICGILDPHCSLWAHVSQRFLFFVFLSFPLLSALFDEKTRFISD